MTWRPMMGRRGPKTATGKAAVRHNAVRHGILSTSLAVPGLEQEDEWTAHHAAIIASLAPEGYLEQALADRVAQASWRLRRIARHEREVIGVALERVEEDLTVRYR